MNRSLVTGLVIGAAVVTAGAAVANFARSDRTTEANAEAPAPPVDGRQHRFSLRCSHSACVPWAVSGGAR